MAGTLQVNEHVAWMPAGWIFNNVLERISDRLVADDPELSEIVGDALGPVPGHLDLSLLNADRLQLFVRAAEEVFRRVQAAGHSSFPDVSYYERYLSQFEQLMQFLHADPRIGSTAD